MGEIASVGPTSTAAEPAPAAPSNPAQPASGRRRLGRLGAALVGLAMLAGLVWLSHPSQVALALPRVQPAQVVLALLLNAPLVLVRAQRARLVLHRLGHGVPLGRMLAVQIVGQASSSLTPAAGGDVVRALLWRRDDGVSLRKGVAAVAFERVFGLVLLAAVAFVLSWLALGGRPATWLLALPLLVVPASLPLLFGRLPVQREQAVLRRLRRLPSLAGFADRLLDSLAHLRALCASPGLLAGAGALTMASFLCSGLQVWLLLLGVGAAVDAPAAVGAQLISQLGGILSTLPFGLGAADVLLVSLLVRLGVAVTAATAVAVLNRAVSTLPQALAAAVAWWALAGRRPAARSRPLGVEAD